MPRRSKNMIEKISPTLSPTKGRELIKRQLDQIDKLIKLQHDDPEIRKWDNTTEQVIIKTFGKPHDNLSHYSSALHGGSMLLTGETNWQAEHVENMNKVKKLLEGFVEQLDIFNEPNKQLDKDISTNNKPISRKVFIVHGHDKQAISELTVILSNLGLKPIVLHEQASEGMTLIEKLEKYSNVGYAFIILTPDDLGTKKDIKDIKTNLKPRARQNVVFEFGLFVGKLGRNKVCCLYKGNVKLPSDLDGLVYIPFNLSINEKQIDIIRELKAAGYKVKV